MFHNLTHHKRAKVLTTRKNKLKKQQFSYRHHLEAGIVAKSESVTEVLRGMTPQDAPIVFHPQAWFGFSSRKAITRLPVVTLDEVTLHKDSLFHGDYYLKRLQINFNAL